MHEEVALQVLLSYNGDFKTLEKKCDSYFMLVKTEAQIINNNSNNILYDQENDQLFDQHDERLILDKEDECLLRAYEQETNKNVANREVTNPTQNLNHASKKKRRRRKKKEENIVRIKKKYYSKSFRNGIYAKIWKFFSTILKMLLQRKTKKWKT